MVRLAFHFPPALLEGLSDEERGTFFDLLGTAWMASQEAIRLGMGGRWNLAAQMLEDGRGRIVEVGTDGD